MKKFGTFGGVFTPTLLTILGVIMYLRLGWVVGNAGLLGALLIIFLSYAITLATALSMSAITTNIKLGAGGAYAIISQALGLEVGGSLGIPRYVSQGLAVTMYIFGFREGWLMIFPEHPSFIVDLTVFIILYGIAYKSADLAIKTQYIVMGVIFLSLISIVIAATQGSMHLDTEEALKWGNFSGVSGDSNEGFWIVFAVFFPASTGIMAGANMSGELKDPRTSIPSGTLWAIGLSFIVYIFLTIWIAYSATETELVNNFNIIIEKSFFPPLVIAGVLGATFSSALASLIGSSRILFAMGQHRVLPKGEWLEYQDNAGQPRNAMIVTGILIFSTMLLRDLNAIAPLVTMFFLITYAMLNVVVIIEQKLGLISFRPIFVVSKFIPWIGLVGSLVAMFIINPTMSLVSWTLMFFVYTILSRRKLETQFEDVRSGLFTSFAEWAAKQTAEDAHKQERSWKPNLLIPATDTAIVQGSFPILKDIAYPKGSAVLMGIGKQDSLKEKNKLDYISNSFKRAEVFSSTIIMRTDSFAEGVNFGNQALTGAFFRPNIVFLNMLEKEETIQDYPLIIKEAARLELGVILYMPHRITMLGQQQIINVWITSRSPEWDIDDDRFNPNLALLTAYKLHCNWNATIRLITVIPNEEEKEIAIKFLGELINLARLPIDEKVIIIGNFYEKLQEAPIADLNIFGLFTDTDFDIYRNMCADMGTSCLFVRNSGNENIFA
ncbi:MAG: amino acid permease [Saprospiraceae bacterium]